MSCSERATCAFEERFVFAEGGYDTHEPHAFEGRWSETDPPIEGNYYTKARLQQEIPASVCRTTMIRDLTHKFVRCTEGLSELYDLNDDPRELRNRIDDPSMTTVRHRLESTLLAWFVKTSDTVPVGQDSRRF